LHANEETEPHYIWVAVLQQASLWWRGWNSPPSHHITPLFTDLNTFSIFTIHHHFTHHIHIPSLTLHYSTHHIFSHKKYSLITSPPLFTHSNTCMQFSLFILSGFSTAGSKFVSIVCQARMVSTGDNGIRLVRASEE
jgi:hypothetical protein